MRKSLHVEVVRFPAPRRSSDLAQDPGLQRVVAWLVQQIPSSRPARNGTGGSCARIGTWLGNGRANKSASEDAFARPPFESSEGHGPKQIDTQSHVAVVTTRPLASGAAARWP